MPAAMCTVTLVPMTVHSKHLRGSAGASFTKADVCSCCGQMRPVSHNWSKQQRRRAGYQA